MQNKFIQNLESLTDRIYVQPPSLFDRMNQALEPDLTVRLTDPSASTARSRFQDRCLSCACLQEAEFCAVRMQEADTIVPDMQSSDAPQ